MDTAPAPEQQASGVGPSPATRALCGQILSPLWNSIPHCKMSGFRGSGSVSGVPDEVVLIDRPAERRATEQAVGVGPEVVFLDSSHLGICPLHFADGKRRVRGAGGCCEGQGFPCYSQPLGPTLHHNSQGHCHQPASFSSWAWVAIHQRSDWTPQLRDPWRPALWRWPAAGPLWVPAPSLWSRRGSSGPWMLCKIVWG